MSEQTLDHLVLFDGDCNLCNRAVQFILSHEADKELHFVSSTSSLGQKVLRNFGFTTRPGSLVVIADGRAYTKSSATIRLAAHLRTPWNWVRLMVMIPQIIRDGVYTWIAENRHWLSRQLPTCRLGSPELANRFLS